MFDGKHVCDGVFPPPPLLPSPVYHFILIRFIVINSNWLISKLNANVRRFQLFEFKPVLCGVLRLCRLSAMCRKRCCFAPVHFLYPFFVLCLDWIQFNEINACVCYLNKLSISVAFFASSYVNLNLISCISSLFTFPFLIIQSNIHLNVM